MNGWIVRFEGWIDLRDGPCGRGTLPILMYLFIKLTMCHLQRGLPSVQVSPIEHDLRFKNDQTIRS